MRFLSKWWNGKQPPSSVKIGGRLMIISGSEAERHWTANIAHAIVNFYVRNWQWLLGSLIAIVLAVYFG